MGFESFVSAYIVAALWSSSDESDDNGGEPLDSNYDHTDLTDDAVSKMTADCQSFYDDKSNQAGLEYWREQFGDDEQAGHDFWLTRNGHGAGFWDRFYNSQDPGVEIGKELTKAAKAYGSADLYVSDGKIHHG